LVCFFLALGFFFFSPLEDFFLSFLEGAAFFLGAGVEGVEVVGAAEGTGAGEGRGVLSLGSGAAAGRGVEGSTCVVFSRLREIRPPASRVMPALEAEEMTKRRRTTLAIKFMMQTLPPTG
jgi:hypothetical protein